MTVRELAAKLNALPPDARVVVAGYEDGYEDVDDVLPIKIVLNVRGPWYVGRHAAAREKQPGSPAAFIVGDTAGRRS